MPQRLSMNIIVRFLIVFTFCAAVAPRAHAEIDATLFRVFFIDGTSVVSFGELARVNDQVIFSMPVGGSPQDPRLHPVTLEASLVDWARTERHAVSARYQQYAATRAETDYQRLSDEVAALLNDIAVSTDRARALALAQQARRTLSDWPRTHFGYRQEDVRDIIGLIDGAIARLRGDTAANAFEVSLFAVSQPIPIEPMAAMPSAREQLDQIVRVLRLTTSGRDRVALLQSGLAFLKESGASMTGRDITAVRRTLERQLQQEIDIDRRYASLTRHVLADATRAAARARVDAVEQALNRIPREDAKLGRRRPEVVQALTGSVRRQLDGARQLRLLRDQWTVRQALFREYQRSIGSEVLQLVQAQASLEAIRRLDGPEPGRLAALRTRLSGGAARLQRLPIPDYLRATHELVVGAWRFAESAVNTRTQAVSSGNITTAWEASSAAAGALMMLSRAQQEIRALIEPPKLQ
jgi:hypothetical protein